MITDRPPAEPNRCCQCGALAEWLSLYTDARCRSHPPRYDSAVAAELALRGWPDTAAVYRRTFTRTRREAA